MNTVNNNERAPEHSLSEKEFQFICKLVYDTTGIVLDGRKREMVYRRLMRRTRDLKLASFKAYCQLLQTDKEGEFPKFINAITTNLTSFFREEHHFDYLRDDFIPKHIKKYAHTRRLRIWSAACSTGEEPYSLAITLLQAMAPLLGEWDIKILASDLDTDVLAAAKAGIYKDERIKDLPTSLTKSWFRRGSGENAHHVKVNPSMSELITFKQLNLLHEWPMRGPFDVIMCRNVLIYFDKATQKKLIHRYHQLLRPGGLLILGHSESLAKDESFFRVKGRTIFEKPIAVDAPVRKGTL